MLLNLMCFTWKYKSVHCLLANDLLRAKFKAGPRCTVTPPQHLQRALSETSKTFLGKQEFGSLIWKCFLRICGFYSSACHAADDLPRKCGWIWREEALWGIVLIYCSEASAPVVCLNSLNLWSRCPPLCCFPTGVGAQRNEWWLGFRKGSFPE